MTPLAMFLIVCIAFFVGFVTGYLAGRGEDRDRRKGHPYDYKGLTQKRKDD